MATTQAMCPLPELTLAAGMKITFEALDPATSLAVAGVTVGRVSIAGNPSAEKVADIPLRDLMRVTPPRRSTTATRASGGTPAAATTRPGTARKPR